MNLYLAHSIHDRRWIREVLEPQLNDAGIQTTNPFYGDPRAQARMKDIDAGVIPEYSEFLDHNELVLDDAKKIAAADALLYILMKHPSPGASMELAHAFHAHKKIFALILNKKYLGHPWIRHHTEQSGGGIFKSVEELITFMTIVEQFTRLPEKEEVPTR